MIDSSAGLNDYIGQHNNGFHNALFQDVQQYLAGKDILVPITTEQAPGIDDGPDSCGALGGAPAGGGCFQGWAVFTSWQPSAATTSTSMATSWAAPSHPAGRSKTAERHARARSATTTVCAGRRR